MCNYWTGLVTRDGKVHYSLRTESHEDLIKEAKVKDVKLVNRDLVRVEITPKEMPPNSLNMKDWVFKVDEEKTLPGWFTKARGKHVKNCWKAWTVAVKQQVFLDGTHTIKDIQAKAWGSSTVEAWGSSTVKAWGSSTVEACGSSTVIKWSKDAKVTLKDQAVLVDRSGEKVVVKAEEKVTAK